MRVPFYSWNMGMSESFPKVFAKSEEAEPTIT